MEISKDQLKQILSGAPPGSDPKKIIKSLQAQGNTIEGLSSGEQVQSQSPLTASVLKHIGAAQQQQQEPLYQAKKQLKEQAPMVSNVLGTIQSAQNYQNLSEDEKLKLTPEFKDALKYTGDEQKALEMLKEETVGQKAWEGIKQGTLTGAEGIQKIGASITGDTSGLEGFKQFYGLKKPEEIDIKQLTPAERGQMFGEGLLGFSTGTLGTAMAAPGAALEAVPVIGEPIGEAFGAIQKGGGKAVSEPVKFVAEKFGIDLSPEQISAIEQGGETVAGLMMLKIAEEGAKQAKVESLSTQIQQAFRKNDLATVKELLPQYEASIAKPTIAGTTGQAIQGITQAGLEGAAGIAGAGLKGIGKIGEGLGLTAKTLTAKATGLNPETLSFVNKNPKLFESVQKGEITREGVAKDIISKINQKQSSIGETGKAYDIIRQSTDKVKIPKKEIDSSLTQKGLKIKNGKIQEVNPLDTNLSTADLTAIDKAYSLLKGKNNLTANEYLNFRNKLDDLVNWKTDVSSKGQSIVKQMRKIVDDVAKKDITGLKELDATYKTEISALRQLKKDYFNKDGSLKDNALSKMSNLTNKGREAILERIEKLSPGLGDKIRALKAYEDVNIASGNKIGAYGSSILGVGVGLGTGSIPAAIATLITTNPKLIINAVKNYAKARNMASGSITGILNKVESGAQLAPKEISTVKEAIDYSGVPLLATNPANEAKINNSTQPIE